MFGLFRREPTTIVINETTVVEITDEEMKDAHEKRVTELLDHNNSQLEDNRALKALVRQLVSVAEKNSDLLIEHSATTGYCGCDLEKETFLAVSRAKEILNVR